MRLNRKVTALLAVLGMGLCAGAAQAAYINSLFVTDDSFPAGPGILVGSTLFPSVIDLNGNNIATVDVVTTAFSALQSTPLSTTNEFAFSRSFEIQGLTTQLYGVNPRMVQGENVTDVINTKIELFQGSNLLGTINGEEGFFASPIVVAPGDYSIVTTYTPEGGAQLKYRTFSSNVGLFFQPGAGTYTGNLNAGNAIVAVPEPATLSLVGIGASALLLRRRR